jgi:hypothetical protein
MADTVDMTRMKEVCTPEICTEKWKQVHEKLNTMHDDFVELRRVVQNGIVARVQRIEFEREAEKAEQERRRKHWARWEAAAASIVMCAVGAVVLFVAKLYFDAQTTETRAILGSEIRQPHSNPKGKP